MHAVPRELDIRVFPLWPSLVGSIYSMHSRRTKNSLDFLARNTPLPPAPVRPSRSYATGNSIPASTEANLSHGRKGGTGLDCPPLLWIQKFSLSLLFLAVVPHEFAFSIILFAAALRVMRSPRIYRVPFSQQPEENPAATPPTSRNRKATLALFSPPFLPPPFHPTECMSDREIANRRVSAAPRFLSRVRFSSNRAGWRWSSIRLRSPFPRSFCI